MHRLRLRSADRSAFPPSRPTSGFRGATQRLAIPAVLLLLVLSSVATAGSEPAGRSPALPDPLAAGWQGEPVCESLADDASHRILRCTFPPGIGHEPHFHAPHFGYVLAGGSMRITDAEGTRVVDLETGSVWESDGVARHEVVNIGNTTAAFLIVEPSGAEGPVRREIVDPTDR